jgi:hypothetical protein
MHVTLTEHTHSTVAPRILNFVRLCGKGNHRGARLAMEAMVDLLRNNLLPERPLLSLDMRPILSSDITDAHLLFWTFETILKLKVNELLEVRSPKPYPSPPTNEEIEVRSRTFLSNIPP